MIILPKNSLTLRGSCFRAFHFPVSLKKERGGKKKKKKKRVDAFPSEPDLLNVKESWRKANLFQGTENAFGAGGEEEAENRSDHMRRNIHQDDRRMPISQVSTDLSPGPGEASAARAAHGLQITPWHTLRLARN